MPPIQTTDPAQNRTRLQCIDAVLAAALAPEVTDRLLREIWRRWMVVDCVALQGGGL